MSKNVYHLPTELTQEYHNFLDLRTRPIGVMLGFDEESIAQGFKRYIERVREIEQEQTYE